MRATVRVTDTGVQQVRTLNGEIYAFQGAPREVEFYLRCDGEEAMEINRRMQGMPGWPLPGEEMEREPPDRNFDRKMDVA